jgi:hypothetical protein
VLSKERPIFVVGFERSGTTVLQALLGAHPRIAAPPEIHFLFRIAGLADHYGDLADDGNLRAALRDTLNPPVPFLAGCGFDEEALFRTALAGDRSYRGLLALVMDDFAQRQGKRRWSEKTPGQSVEAVLGLFPEAQVVHLIRDPRDVVASALEAPWASSTARQLTLEWRRFTLANIETGAQAGPNSYIQLRYEDLVREPEVVLRTTTAFLGEEFSPDMLSNTTARRQTVAPVAASWQGRALEPIDTSRKGQWRERLSKVQQAQVAAVVRKDLAPLGYRHPGRRQTMFGELVNRLASIRALPTRRRNARQATRTTADERFVLAQQYMRSVAVAIETNGAPSSPVR